MENLFHRLASSPSKQGKEEAVSQPQDEFLKLYDEKADAIFRHCYYRLRDREVAQEIMQETFMRTWVHLRDNGPIQHMKAFLYRVANNLIIDTVRKKKSASLEELQEAGWQPQAKEGAETMKMLVEGERIRGIVNKLDPKYRTVVMMRYIDDLSPQEIADVLGISPNSVSVQIHRGLAQLRDLISNG